MITINEAIDYFEGQANIYDMNSRYATSYDDKIRWRICASEHRQFAEWLRELKAYRANEGMSENVYKAGYKFGYKRAMDEVAKK